jgi:hypothetical protein
LPFVLSGSEANETRCQINVEEAVDSTKQEHKTGGSDKSNGKARKEEVVWPTVAINPVGGNQEARTHDR